MGLPLRNGIRRGGTTVDGHRLAAEFEMKSENTDHQKLLSRRGRKPAGADVSLSASPKQGPRIGFGFMKGLLTIEEGYDVSKPSGWEWDHPGDG
jgi:hypothetical protein